MMQCWISLRWGLAREESAGEGARHLRSAIGTYHRGGGVLIVFNFRAARLVLCVTEFKSSATQTPTRAGHRFARGTANYLGCLRNNLAFGAC
jgi:hypothetical protein